MSDMILNINDLTVHYETDGGVVEAVNHVSLSIKKGEVLGLVGETGAGKTTIALSVMGLLPYPPSRIVTGSIELDGEMITEISTKNTTSLKHQRIYQDEKKMQRIRGNRVGMIFQDPMSALNPVMPVGRQVEEVIKKHNDCSEAEARQRALDMLGMVGIQPDRFNDYPHQFSGGMKQRVVIAIALACKPDLLIADEATTALDVTIQAQVLEMMKDLQKKLNTAMLVITHDFGIVADICDRCAVIYAGEVVEMGTLEHIFRDARHPYTVGLFDAIPSLDKRVKRLKPVPGMVINPTELPEFCSFYNRCEHRCDECRNLDPKLMDVGGGHLVKCIRAEKKETSV